MEKKEEKGIAKKEKTEKVTKFAAILSQLRKERGISQKNAAKDLGISQALLSHYEKGIRECGLDFVIKCSEYYGVTTDYLLGVSENRNGIDMSFMPALAECENTSAETLIQASIILLNMIKSMDDTSTFKYVYDYYILSIYRGALSMAKAGVLPKEMFKINLNVARELASAAIAVEDAKFVFIEDKSRTGTDLSERTALHQIITRAEELILNDFILE